MTRTLETMKGLYLSGYFADDATSDGTTFKEVVEGLDALDEITPPPHTTAPTAVRRLCFNCRGWYDGTPSSALCPACQAAVDDIERSTIERNRRRVTLCTLCGAESRTFVCEACSTRPMSRREPFDYRRLEQQAVSELYGDGPAVIDRVFCENCGAALPALFKDDGTPMGVEDCMVCAGLPTVWGAGTYCRRCGSRKIRMNSTIGCPHCG